MSLPFCSFVLLPLQERSIYFLAPESDGAVFRLHSNIVVSSLRWRNDLSLSEKTINVSRWGTSFLHRFCLFMFVAVRGPLCFLNSFSELLSPIVTTACNFVLSIFVLRPPQYLSHQAVFVGAGTTVIGVSGQKGTF